MPMPRASLRLPDDIQRAYELADGGSKSHLMRRVLTEAVADGQVEGVPPDLRKLAQRERAVDSGRYMRKRATYKSRLYGFYQEKWQDGAVTPTNAAELAASWREEAALYDADRDDGDPHDAFLDAVLEWYRANWSRTAAERPEWPDAGRLLRAAGIAADDEAGGLGARSELVDALDDYAEDGVEPSDALERLHEEYDADAGDAFAALAESEEYDADDANGGETV